METKYLLTLALFAIVSLVSAVEYAPTVQIAGGKVRGTVQEVEDHGKVHLYQGIRYGKLLLSLPVVG